MVWDNFFSNICIFIMVIHIIAAIIGFAASFAIDDSGAKVTLIGKILAAFVYIFIYFQMSLFFEEVGPVQLLIKAAG